MSFGERLTVAMARKRVTMKHLGEKCGATAQAVFKWTHEEAMPSSGKLLVICKELDCSIEWLFAPEPLDFHSTETAPQGRHAKYWVREAIGELCEQGLLHKGGHA